MSATNDAAQQVVLNDEQINAIINYAVEAKLYDGQPPEDPEMRRSDAALLVVQARRARDNGNQSPHVREVCFLADVDQKADNVPTAPTIDPAAAFAPQPPQQQAPPSNGGSPPASNGDGDSELMKLSDEQLSQIIEALSPNQDVPAIRTEIERHRAEQLRRQSAGVKAQAQVPPSTPQGAPAPQPPAVQTPQAPAPVPPPSSEQALPGGDRDASGQSRPRADAPADSGASPFEPSTQGQPAQAQAPAQDARRAELMRQVTFGVLEAYGKTFQDLERMPTEDIERMLFAPGGPAPAQPPAPAISHERAGLEEQITGPMLKAWGRGRTQIPQLSDDDLREMVSYPAGPTTRPQGDPFIAESQPPSSGPALFQPTQPGPVQVPQQSQAQTISPTPSQPQSGVQRATEIIAREKLPIAPDIAETPVLPPDISKTSDVDLRSLHGRFHAVEARVNWLVSEEQDKIDDLERLRNIRDAEVRNQPREGKRPTKDEMQALVDADGQVRAYDEQIHEIRKTINKLRVIRDNAHSTVQRCSREFAMRFGEAEPGKRGTP